ncbi:MAG: UDP-N-acetylmuramoyl-L-alanyl-D-glutamate--2,6-diaminopimelate ligase [Planctomycetia bacterium]|nr:UDP-N-acetylmuramoyl-L-alanyl-D-glutamate--2,6-diaminopimelate ligase [Planctomycetia bacterium]
MQSCYQGISPVSLRKLFPKAEIFGAEDYTLLNCTTDVQRVRPGDLFVAVRGKVDGHALLDEAIARGAGALMTEEMTDNPFRIDSQGRLVPMWVVENTRQAYALLCQALYRFPGKRLALTGITGTSGKTMTSCLIASVLGAAGYNVGIIGSLGCFDGLDASPHSIANLPPKRVSSWLSRMEQNDCTHAVVEVSSQALAQYRLEGLAFQTVCMTNIRQEHLGFHGSVENYRKAKMRILEHLAEEGVTILNADDKILAEITRWLDIPVLTYGIQEPAEISGILLEQTTSEQTMLVTAGGETLPLRTPIIGNHFAYDCLAAVATGLRMGIPLETVVQGIESVESMPGRMERIECGQPFTVLVDRAHTAEELKITLQSLREVVDGKIFCVLGAAGNRDFEKRPQMGAVAQQYADEIILTDSNPATESPDKIIQDILSGMRPPANVTIYHQRTDAIPYALGQARPGDCVLVAGKGHEKFQLVGRESLRHDDREMIRRWLYQNVHSMDFRH